MATHHAGTATNRIAVMGLAAATLAGLAAGCSGGSSQSAAATSTGAPATAGPTTAAPASSTTAAPTTAAPATTASSQPPTTPAPAGSLVRRTDWMNRTYPGDLCGDEGDDGAVEASGGRISSGEGGEIRINESIVFGDVTGDGREEAVVSIVCSTGGTLSWSVGWLYTDGDEPGELRRLARVEPPRNDAGDYTVGARHLESASISGGVLTTRWATYAADDPNCCPSQVATFRQRWMGSVLLHEGEPAITPRPAG
jgi:hypothetical protein